MRIKPIHILFFMMLIISTRICYIIPFNADNYLSLHTLLCLIGFIVYGRGDYWNRIGYSAKMYTYIIIIIASLELVRNAINYGYSFYDSFIALRIYLNIFAIFPIASMVIGDGDIDKMVREIVFFVMLGLLINSIVWLFYVLGGITINENVLASAGSVLTRYERVRLAAPPITAIGIPCIMYLFYKTKKRKYLFNLGLAVIYMAVIANQRIMTICSLGTIMLSGVYYFISKYKRKKKRMIVVLCMFVVLLPVIYVIVSGILSDYLGLSSNTFDKGLGYRYWELDYYLGLMDRDKIITGLGILSETNTTTNQLLWGPLSTKMYLDDLGPLRTFLQFGLLSIVLYGGQIVYILNTINLLKKKGKIDWMVFLIGSEAYLITSSLSMDMFGRNSSFVVAIVMALAMSMRYLLGNQKKLYCLDRKINLIIGEIR